MILHQSNEYYAIAMTDKWRAGMMCVFAEIEWTTVKAHVFEVVFSTWEVNSEQSVKNTMKTSHSTYSSRSNSISDICRLSCLKTSSYSAHIQVDQRSRTNFLSRVHFWILWFDVGLLLLQSKPRHPVARCHCTCHRALHWTPNDNLINKSKKTRKNAVSYLVHDLFLCGCISKQTLHKFTLALWML